MKVKVKISKGYTDAELGRWVSEGGDIVVSSERAMKLVNHHVAEIIGIEPEDDQFHRQLAEKDAEIARLQRLLSESEPETGPSRRGRPTKQPE